MQPKLPASIVSIFLALFISIFAFVVPHILSAEESGIKWSLGDPDLVIKTPWVTMKATAPDYAGGLTPASTGLVEDRLVKSLEIREENYLQQSEPGKTTAAPEVFYSLLWTTAVPGMESSLGDSGEASGKWPIYNLGRTTYIFSDHEGRLLKASANVIFASAHLHPNGQDTKARLLLGFKFFPKDFKPTFKRVRFSLKLPLAADL